MHQSIWKLTALAVVVGIGVLVVIQAQQGINKKQQDAAQEQQEGESGPIEETASTSPNRSPLVAPPNGDSDPSLLEDEITVPASAKTVSGNSQRARPALATDDDAFDLDRDSFSANSRTAGPRDQGIETPEPEASTVSRLKSSEPVVSTRSRKSLADVDLIDLSTDEDLMDDRSPPAKSATKTTSRAPARSPMLQLNPLDDESETTEKGSTISAESREPAPPRTLSGARNSAPRLMAVLNEEEDTDDAQPADDAADRARAQPDSSKMVEEDEDDFPSMGDDRAKPVTRAPPKSKAILPEGDLDTDVDDDMPVGNRAPPQRRMPAVSRTPPADTPEDEPEIEEDDDAAFSSRSRATSKSDPDALEGGDIAVPARDRLREEPISGRPTKPTGSARPLPAEEDDRDDESISIEERAGSSGRPAPLRTEPSPISETDDTDFPKGPAREANPPDRSGSSVPVPVATEADEAQFDNSSSGRSRPTPRNDDPAPRLTIEKIAPSTAVLGQPMVYQIVVRNAGDIPARQVIVEEEAQPEVKVLGSIPQAMLDNGKLIWKLGALEPGKERKIAVKVIPQSEGTIGAAATVHTARGNIDDEPVAGTKRGPTLRFEIDVQRQASIGTPIPFRFKVTNVGRTDATGVVIRDVLPAGLRHPDGDDLEYEIGMLPAGKSRDVELMLTAAQPGRTINRAVVTADGNVTEEASVTLDVSGPALNITRGGPRRLLPNKPGQYTNTVTNPGSTPALNVRIVETIPPGMDFVEASDGGEYNPSRRSITWNFDRLEANESKSVRSRLHPTGRGAQVSVVRAHDATGGTGETVGTTHVSGSPALTIDVSEIAPNIEVGEEIRVPIRILNRGSDGATNVRAAITIPAGMDLVSARGPVDYTTRKTNMQDRSQSRTFKEQQELQFAPIARLEPRSDAVIELTLKGRRTGNARLQLSVECDEVNEPVRREEVLPIVALPD